MGVGGIELTEELVLEAVDEGAAGAAVDQRHGIGVEVLARRVLGPARAAGPLARRHRLPVALVRRPFPLPQSTKRAKNPGSLVIAQVVHPTSVHKSLRDQQSNS